MGKRPAAAAGIEADSAKAQLVADQLVAAYARHTGRVDGPEFPSRRLPLMRRSEPLGPPRSPAGGSYDRCVITGVHAIVFSPDAEKVRAFFADVLGLPSVDAGGGWLIFALPPAELAVHPGDGADRREIYLMCDNIGATLAELREKGVEVVRDVSDQGWGLLAIVRLPDGNEFPIYEPRHPSPLQP